MTTDDEVKRLLGEARAKAVAKRKDEERRRFLRAEAHRQLEQRQQAILSTHGALLWRAARFWHQSHFIRSILRDFQTSGALTIHQLNGLAKATTWAEHNDPEGGFR